MSTASYPVAYRRGASAFKPAPVVSFPNPRIPRVPLRTLTTPGLRPPRAANLPGAPNIGRSSRMLRLGGVAALVAAALEAYGQLRSDGLPAGPVGEGSPGSPADFTHGKSWPRPDLATTNPLSMNPAVHGWHEPGALRYRTQGGLGWSWSRVQNWTDQPRRIISQTTNDPESSYIQNQLDENFGNAEIDIGWVRTIASSPVKYEYYAREYWYRTNGTPEVPASAGGQVPLEIPEALPMPAIAPPINPIAPIQNPIPWRDVPGVRRIGEEQDPWPRRLPRARPRLRPRTYPRLRITVRPGVPPQASLHPPAPPRPPRGREKEKKGRSKYDAAWDAFAEVFGTDVKGKFNMFTEAIDWVQAIYYALPEEHQDAGANPALMAWAILTHFEEIDVQDAIQNIVVMEITDRVLGKVSGATKRNIFRAGFEAPNLFGGFV